MARTPAAAAPQHHVDGRDLTFRLEEYVPPIFGMRFGHISRNLRLRGDGVAEEMTAAAPGWRLLRGPRCPSSKLFLP